jgi:hypothetical protein
VTANNANRLKGLPHHPWHHSQAHTREKPKKEKVVTSSFLTYKPTSFYTRPAKKRVFIINLAKAPCKRIYSPA